MGHVVTQDELILHVAEHKRNGQRVVFTNGCFDLLHPGHIRGFEQARALGDVLIVAINSDSSVKFLKGNDRPIIPQNERAEILAALAAVDYVVIFDDLTAEGLLRDLRPHVQCKGTDYTEDSVPERAVMDALGGVVRIVGDPKAHSTREILTEIIQRMSNRRS